MYRYLLVLWFLIVACASNPPQPQGKPLGLVKVDISATGHASAQWVGSLNPQTVAVRPINGTSGLNDLQFEKSAVQTYDDPIHNRRYSVTSFILTNRTDYAFNNLTLYAVNVPGTTQAGTGIASIRDFAGNSLTEEAIFRDFRPSHAMESGTGGLGVSAPTADLQWITPSEAASTQSQATGQGIIPDTATVLEYGFVARNEVPESRQISARNTATDCTASSCRGSITLGYSFPLRTPAAANPYRFSLYFVVADESDSSVSQSLEEQIPNTVTGLTSPTGFLQSRIVSGSSYGLGQDGTSNLCQVKTALPSVQNPTYAMLPSSIPTAPGTLDRCFGTGGKVITTIGPDSQAKALALQSDGKIVAAGITINGSIDFALARYNLNGSVDSSFGTGGKVTVDFNSSTDTATALALQGDGKIVVAGNSFNDFALTRHNPDGSLDPSFGTGGKVITDFASSIDMATAIAIQSDSKIVVAGISANDFALARYNPNGSLDPNFGTEGRVTTSFGPNTDQALALVLQPDGKIVVAGFSANYFALARYQPDGSLDTSFGTVGRVLTDFAGSYELADALALQGDGKIVVAGYSSAGGDFDFALARYNSNGSLDTNFGSEGKVTTAVGLTRDQATAVTVQGDGKIVLAGLSHNGTHNDFALARYSADGSLDAGFGAGGMVTTPVGSGANQINAVVLQSNGKITAAGLSQNGLTNKFALARYNP